MAHTNFNSALMMKNENVKHVHYNMAVQQATYMNYISNFIKEKDWAPSAKATQATQRKIIEHFIYHNLENVWIPSKHTQAIFL